MPFHPLASEADLQKAIEASFDGPVILFKHSLTCPISAAAQAAMNRAVAAADVAVYRLVIQEARPLSQHIARAFGIRHESPQAIALLSGHALAHASHFDVTEQWVLEQGEDA